MFWHLNQNILIYCILQQFIEFGVRPGTVPTPPPLFLQKKVSNPSNRAKYHLRSYFMRYLAKTNTFLWNNMISALGATIQKKIDFTLKNYETPLKCAIICFVSEADIILSWNAKFRFNLNNINDKKWSPKIFKILSIFRLNSEVNVFHYALEVCVFTMFRSGNILTILRGHIVVLTFKPKYTHLLHIATIYRVWSETRYCAHPLFSYKKKFQIHQIVQNIILGPIPCVT